MPAKNIIKTYVSGGIYHIYNRGVEKRVIYQDEKDYKTFLSYLKLYLTPPPPESLETAFPSKLLKNFSDEIGLFAYCLMPNHFHLIIHQIPNDGINRFMKSIGIKYSMYFNRRYRRVGSLFQSNYKAVLIKSDEQLMYLSKYIHLNPTAAGLDPEVYPYSSLRNYIGIINQNWVKPQTILEYFSSRHPSTDYQQFVNESDNYPLKKSITIE